MSFSSMQRLATHSRSHFLVKSPGIRLFRNASAETRSGNGGQRKKFVKIAVGGLLFGAGVAGAPVLREKFGQGKNGAIVKQVGFEAGSADYAYHGEVPDFKVARSIRNPADNTGIKFTLFQYQTCPFCCKARAFLDYFGLNYDVIEVNSVTRTQLKWSKAYKKVPILMAETSDGKKFQLIDSSALISTLFSLLFDRPAGGLDEILTCYPQNRVDEFGNPRKNAEIMNRYFLMYKDNDAGKDKKAITEERKWRKWVDDTLVHTLSPNVYRSPAEAREAFKWFDKAGNWPEHFATWERYLVINVGAAAMWMIGKRLKKRHNLKDDVRQSLYDEVGLWTRSIKAKKSEFMGGNQPDLSDLAVFGVLSAIEGCAAFDDLLKNTNVGPWYYAVKGACEAHSGQTIFNRAS